MRVEVVEGHIQAELRVLVELAGEQMDQLYIPLSLLLQLLIRAGVAEVAEVVVLLAVMAALAAPAL